MRVFKESTPRSTHYWNFYEYPRHFYCGSVVLTPLHQGLVSNWQRHAAILAFQHLYVWTNFA